MKLPIVSRAHHEAVVSVYAQAMDDMRMRCTSLEARLVYLHAPPIPEPTPVAPEPKPASPIAKLIREQASESGKMDHALAKHLRGYAKSLEAQGKTQDEILGALVAWQNTESMFTEA